MTQTVPLARDDAWTPVCAFVRLPVERGVCALVRGTAVAVFRTYDDQVYALANHDPFSRGGVLSRGIVGTRGDVPFVASPRHKQAFDLRTGRCLGDPSVTVATYPVRVVDGMVLLGPRGACPPGGPCGLVPETLAAEEGPG